MEVEIWENESEAQRLGRMIKYQMNCNPSVIMYSIGNEIGDIGKESGAVLNRQLADFCRSLDPTRPVINCINPVVSFMGGAPSKSKTDDIVDPYRETKNSQATASLLANIIVTIVLFMQVALGTPKKTEKILRPCFDALDIVGLNYAEKLYEPHHNFVSDRVMLGSETYPHSMAKRGPLVMKHNYVLGDFIWTAMDYLGEAGVGVPLYGTSTGGFNRPYPCVSGGCGTINLIGHPETEAYAAAIAWGEYTRPYTTNLHNQFSIIIINLSNRIIRFPLQSEAIDYSDIQMVVVNAISKWETSHGNQ